MISSIALLFIVLFGLGCIDSGIESYKPQQLPDGVYEVNTRMTEAEDFPHLFESYNAVREIKIRYTTSNSVQGNWISLTVIEFESIKDAQQMEDITGKRDLEFRDGQFIIVMNYGNKALMYDAVGILDQVKGVKAI
jgi:hypothetical protein